MKMEITDDEYTVGYEMYGKLMIAMYAIADIVKEKSLDFPEWFLSRADWVKREISGRVCHIVVQGGYKSGKTTTVNKFLGEKVLPVKSYSSTKTLCRVLYAEDYKVETISFAGERTSFSCKDAKSVQQKILELWEGSTDKIKEIQVGVPSEWLKNSRMEIIDQADADKDSAQEHRVMSVFTISAIVPFDRVERQLLKNLIVQRESAGIVIFITGLENMEESDQHQIVGFLRKRIAQAMLEEAECAADDEKQRLTEFAENINIIADFQFEKDVLPIDQIRTLAIHIFSSLKKHNIDLVSRWIFSVRSWLNIKKQEMLTRCCELNRELQKTEEKKHFLEQAWEGFLISEESSGLKAMLIPVFQEVLEDFPMCYADILTQGLDETFENCLNKVVQDVREKWDVQVDSNFQKILSKSPGMFVSLELKMVRLPGNEINKEIRDAVANAVCGKLQSNLEQVDQVLKELSCKIRENIKELLEQIPNFNADCDEIRNLIQEKWELNTDQTLLQKPEEVLCIKEFAGIAEQISQTVSSYCNQYQKKKETIQAEYKATDKKKPKPANCLSILDQQPKICFDWNETPSIDWKEGELYTAVLPAVGRTLRLRFYKVLEQWAEEMDKSYAQVLRKRGMIRTELFLAINKRKKQLLEEQLDKTEKQAAIITEADRIYSDL